MGTRPFTKIFRSLMIVVIANTLVGCSRVPDESKAFEAVAAIRQEFSQNEFRKVFDESSPEFQKVVDYDSFNGRLSDLRSEIGDTDRWELVKKITVYDFAYGNLLKLTYRSKIDSSALESDEFLLKGDSGTWQLYNYSITRRSQRP